MKKKLDELINKCYEMCDYIESNNVVKDDLKKPLKDVLKNDFLQYILYLSMLDSRLIKSEETFIKNIFHIDMSEDRAKSYQEFYHLTPEKFGIKIPLAFKYFVLADAGRKITNDKYNNKKAKVISDTYKELGQCYIAENEKAGELEINAM